MKLDPRHDPIVASLWREGWDTCRIADYLAILQSPRPDDRFRGHPVREADVYNILDRALGRQQSAIVKAS
jgi:hypothetical protein